MALDDGRLGAQCAAYSSRDPLDGHFAGPNRGAFGWLRARIMTEDHGESRVSMRMLRHACGKLLSLTEAEGKADFR